MSPSPTYEELLGKITALEQELSTVRQREETLAAMEEKTRSLLEKAAASEKSYRTLFQESDVGMVHCTLEGYFLKVNRRFAEFCGYPQEELAHKTFKDLTHPDDLAATARGINDLLAGRCQRLAIDKRYVRKDGQIVWGHTSVSPLVDATENSLMLLATIQDIHARKSAEEALGDNLNRHKVIFDNSPLGMIHFDRQGRILDCNEKFVEIMGSTRRKLIGFHTAEKSNPKMRQTLRQALAGEVSVYEDAYTSVTGGKSTFIRVVFNPVTPGKTPSEVIATLEDITNRRVAEEVIARRLLSLTQPLAENAAVAFEDLFNLDDIQLLQDQFAKATGVASIITRPDGTPITKPSNFTRFCMEIVRTSEKGLANCYKSDAALGRLFAEGPLIQPCLSGGLWDAGAGISIDGHHIANWLIGQVRDETQTVEGIRQYAAEIGVNCEQAIRAFSEVPAMSRRHFEEIAQALFTLANSLSTTAYRNVQQARVITELKHTQEKLRESENRMRFALQGANDGLWDADLSSGKLYFSPRSYEILEYPREKISEHIENWQALVHPDDFPRTWQLIAAHLKGQTSILRLEHRLQCWDGDWKWVLIRGKVVEWEENGRAKRITGTLTDIDTRKKIEETQKFLLACDHSAADRDCFRLLARFLTTLLRMECVTINKLAGDPQVAESMAFYLDGDFHEIPSASLAESAGGKVLGKSICAFGRDVRHIFPGDPQLQQIGAESYIGTTLRNSKGKPIGLIATISRTPQENTELAEAVLQLVAIRAAAELERRAAEEERTILQTQLLQAQKMESVGRLAGGVAHDFNNMLGVILGHVEMAEEQTHPADPLLYDLQEIKKAATRSADLTRQLLAFARKQTVSPKIIDLNATVESLLKMLRRLIGEEIELTWLPGSDLWPVKLDPTQVDQILANLTINARDAISGIGKISIETANLVLDKEYCTDHIGFTSGCYVLLMVSDSGCGMDRDTREHIFEPFFTTKEIGRGTGLGLATIYGIVKQNSGFINVYSEPGQGTTFRILLPRYMGERGVNAQEPVLQTVQPGRETILLVEDEPSILQLGKRMLEKMGYDVLAAATPKQAIQLAEVHNTAIDLLLTDVIMPQMNGRELAKHLLGLYPKMVRVFMSGYTADVIAHHGVLEEGVHFLQKPFSKAELSATIRHALEKGEEGLRS